MPLIDLRPQKQRRSAEEMLEHLSTFSLDLKFSAGIWFFSPPDSRFHDKYRPELTIEQRMEIAAELARYGLAAIEAHYPNEINRDNLHLYRQLEESAGVRLLTVIPNLFYEPRFEFGSLSSPIDEVREYAVQLATEALELNRELDTDFAVVWPGIDGYENPFGLDLYTMWDRFEEGLAAAMDVVPGVRIAIEPKPYEPRGVNIYHNTTDGLLMCHDVETRLHNPDNRRLLEEGHALVAMNPEVGHVLMGHEDLAYAFGRILRQARLAHTHWNSQPLGNYDQDLNVGVISPEQGEAALYALKMYGYQGYFGPDLLPERMPVDAALRNCFDALRAMNDRIDQLDHEKILYATMNPDKARGWLEAYLIRMRALRPEILPPLPEME